MTTEITCVICETNPAPPETGGEICDACHARAEEQTHRHMIRMDNDPSYARRAIARAERRGY